MKINARKTSIVSNKKVNIQVRIEPTILPVYDPELIVLVNNHVVGIEIHITKDIHFLREYDQLRISMEIWWAQKICPECATSPE